MTSPLASRRRYVGAWLVFAYLGLCCGFSTFWSLLSWLPLVVMTAVLLGNTGYSLAWAVNISGRIAQERENHTYDLLGVSPVGALGISWALCAGRLHRSQAFAWVYFVVRLLTITLIVALSIALLPILTLTGRAAGETTVDLLYTLVDALAASIVFFTDHIQSFVLGSLVAIAAPTYMRPGSEARFRCMGMFLFLQLAAYGASAFFGLLLLPALYQLLGINGWIANVSLAILGVVIFIAVREGINIAFWRRLVQQLNADSAELDFSAAGAL